MLLPSILSVIAAVTPMLPDALIRTHSYDVLIRRIDHFVDRERHGQIVARLRAERDAILTLNDDTAFLAAINAVLRETSNDRHLQVVLEDASPAPANVGAGDHGIASAMVRPDGIAILKIDGFSQHPASADAIDRAAAKLATARALILDLRDNGGGGEVSFARLLGHLFPERTELNGIAWRTCIARPGVAPDACEQGPPRIERRFTDSPPRPVLAHLPVYVLVSPRTFSAAEAVAYELQQRGRATIVGTSTGGGGSPSAAMDLESAFAVIMPIGRLHPVTTGTGWEGTGVTPDVPVAEAQAQARALMLIDRLPTPSTPKFPNRNRNAGSR